MKYCIFLFVASCFFVKISSQITTDGLVAYYPFNGNANDESGNGNDGTVDGAILTEDRNGDANSAYHFDGYNDFIIVPDAEILRMTDAVTISLWFKTESTASFSAMVLKMAGSEPLSGYKMVIDDNDYARFDIYYDHNDRSQYEITRSYVDLADNVWHHVVGIYDGSGLRLYVDCNLLDEAEYTLGMQANTEPLYMGYDPFNYNPRYFNGEIDDVMIFNRAIDVNEVMELCEDNSITISGDNEVCQGVQDVNYTIAIVDDAVNYTWSYSGTGVSVLNNNNSATLNFENYATSGNLTVEVELSDGTVLNSDLFYIDLNLLPEGVNGISGEDEVCNGETGISYSISEIDNVTSYIWEYNGEGVTIESYANEIEVDFSEDATSGYLSVYAENSCGKGDASELYVNVLSAPETAGEIEGNNEVCVGENGLSYSVSEVENASTYVWQYSGEGATIIGNSNEVTISFSQDAIDGYLSVYGYNSCGSGENSSILIRVSECNQQSSNLKIPNAFSPNGDNINDFFVVDGLVDNTSFIVFDRSGKKLYETYNYQNDWNGLDSEGNELPTGTYWYVVEVPDISTPLKGYIYLKR